MEFGSGHTAKALEGEEWERQQKDWKGYTNGLIRLEPGRWLFPTKFAKFADKYYKFKFRSEDVLVLTWAKSGTTWTQEIVWTMVNNPNLDNPKAEIPVNARVPFVEFDMLMEGAPSPMFLEAFNKACPGKNLEDGMFLQMAETLSNPRILKSHLPFSLLTPSLLDTSKVVAVMRNPKDVIVSYHHHCRLINVHGYVGTFEDFVQYFIDDDLVYSPYWLHLKEVWEKRGHRNLHIMFFEDMKADIKGELRKLDAFLGTKLTEEQLENVVKHTGFGVMRDRSKEKMVPSTHVNADVMKKDGGFFRKGESGDWKNKFSPEMEAKVDKYIQEKLTTFGIKFKFS